MYVLAFTSIWIVFIFTPPWTHVYTGEDTNQDPRRTQKPCISPRLHTIFSSHYYLSSSYHARDPDSVRLLLLWIRPRLPDFHVSIVSNREDEQNTHEIVPSYNNSTAVLLLCTWYLVCLYICALPNCKISENKSDYVLVRRQQFTRHVVWDAHIRTSSHINHTSKNTKKYTLEIKY